MRLHVMTSPWCFSFHVRPMVYIVALMFYAILYRLGPGNVNCKTLRERELENTYIRKI